MGVEKTVPLASGISRPGSEVAKQTFNYLQSLIPGSGTPPALAAAVRYQAMNSVPENWIPFIPVHVPNNNRQIQLQRAAMPRILVGDFNPAQKVQPLTSLLRAGLDLIPAQTYFLHEEEVPRAWRPPHPVLRTRALDAGPGVHVVVRAEANWSWRGCERSRIRSPGRPEPGGGLTR
ncbi:hypothetical protein RBB78_08160 [Tunturiibacter empetritectus]|uniref:hypothetical protein n=1 Tax=Tunturiibacter empetritectus TaxID=3069691 RepID=UPI003D9AE364